MLNGEVRFVVFSFGMQEFYEVTWQTGEEGSVAFDLPKDVGQKWVRSYFGKNLILPLVFGLLKSIGTKEE